MFTTINLQQWIAEHRDLLKPPVANKVIWDEGDFIVMVVGGPNSRNDFHIGPADEIFYQLEGDIIVRLKLDEGFKDVHIKQGEMFLLPAHIPHLPIRGANTIGLVIEKKRINHDQDHFCWYCEKCENLLYKESIYLKDIVKELPLVFEHFNQSEKNRTCTKCGHLNLSSAIDPFRHSREGGNPERN